MHFFDTQHGNLFHYVYMRRLNIAWKECAEGNYLSPNRIMCALAITSPRSYSFAPQEEKGLFQAAVTLSKGFNRDQINSINVVEYAQVATMFNYFTDYEKTMSGNFKKADIIKAIQEGTFPEWFTKAIVDIFFKDRDSNISFMGFSGFFYSCRLFKKYTDSRFISYEQFDQLLNDEMLPARLIEYFDKTYVPTKEEIE